MKGNDNISRGLRFSDINGKCNKDRGNLAVGVLKKDNIGRSQNIDNRRQTGRLVIYATDELLCKEVPACTRVVQTLFIRRDEK